MLQIFFTIWLIFVIIYKSHCTFWYYSWVLLYYFSYFLALSIVLLAIIFQFQQNKRYPNTPYVFVWQKLFLSTYFTIQLIFATIYGSHYTFWYYSWVPLYYFSELIHLSTIISVKSFRKMVYFLFTFMVKFTY